jgi:hypothetical protein
MKKGKLRYEAPELKNSGQRPGLTPQYTILLPNSSSRAEAALDSRVLFAIGLERVEHAGTYYLSLPILIEFLPFYAEIRDSHTTIESGLQYLIFPDPVQIFRSIARAIPSRTKAGRVLKDYAII